MDAAEVSDRNEESLEFLKKLSKEKNAAFCGSAPVEQGGRFYNRMYFVQPDSESFFYDKRHLFSFSGEDKVYSPGHKRVIVNYKGFRILLQVCYDLRFPVFARNNNDYDAVFYIANWPEKRVGAWEHLLKARAIENLSFVFGLNRIGTDGNDLFYQESSHCFFADGKEISQKNGNIISAELNLDELKDFRQHFQFLNDRDHFSIQF
jgi:omega-amidase